MAVSSTSAFEPTRDSLIRRSYHLAGAAEAAQDPSTDDTALAADFLNMVLLDLQADGIVPTHVARTTLALVASTATYALPSDTLDVVLDANNFAGTIIPSSGSETPLFAMTRAEYVSITNKDTEATPTRVYIERLSTVSVVFWPVPDEALTFSYQKQRFARDTDTGAVTLDMSKRWLLALCYELAAHISLAKSMPLDRVRELRKQAEVLKARCRGSDVEKVNYQMGVGRYW